MYGGANKPVGPRRKMEAVHTQHRSVCVCGGGGGGWGTETVGETCGDVHLARHGALGWGLVTACQRALVGSSLFSCFVIDHIHIIALARGTLQTALC